MRCSRRPGGDVEMVCVGKIVGKCCSTVETGTQYFLIIVDIL